MTCFVGPDRGYLTTADVAYSLQVAKTHARFAAGWSAAREQVGVFAMFRMIAIARIALAVWLASGGMVGCAQHRLPAIDPTGQRIFSGTTTLAHHDLLGGGL